jgi:hypothetical protein
MLIAKLQRVEGVSAVALDVSQPGSERLTIDVTSDGFAAAWSSLLTGTIDGRPVDLLGGCRTTPPSRGGRGRRHDAWRLDVARGYSPEVAKVYIDGTSPSLAVAEIWDGISTGGDGKPEYDQDAHRQRLVNWVDKVGGEASAGMVFDFTTKGILNAAVEGELWRLIDPLGKAPGVMGWWPAKAVTFVDNHDTGSTQAKWPFPSDKIMQGYAYILTHPGIPCIVSNQLRRPFYYR